MLQQAELVWAKYTKPDLPKFYLLLYLGQHDKFISAILANNVPAREIKIIRAHLNKLRQMDLKELNQWIKINLPVTYREAYRHFESNNLEIIHNYGLKGFAEASKNP
jgi:hypothetical protein